MRRLAGSMSAGDRVGDFLHVLGECQAVVGVVLYVLGECQAVVG